AFLPFRLSLFALSTNLPAHYISAPPIQAVLFARGGSMRHPSRGGLLAALLVAGSLATACHSRLGPVSDTTADSAADAVDVEIANHNWADIVIYVVRDGFQSRLGVATAATATSFVLPRRMLGQAGELQLFGRPIGGQQRAFTETVIVQPGQWVEWTLESE